MMNKMLSWKGLFTRSFFMCRECDFVWTTLGQASHQMEGACPSCGEYDMDYAPKEEREKFIEGIKIELKAFEEEMKNE